MKVSVDNQKKIWKDHMEKLMNFENEWSDSIGAIKVEGPVRRTEVEYWIVLKYGKQLDLLGLLFKGKGELL